MKKIHIVAVICLFMTSIKVFAQESEGITPSEESPVMLESEVQKDPVATLTNPYMFLSASGAGGLSYPSGVVAGDSVKRIVKPSVSAEIAGGMIFRDFVGASLGCEYLNEDYCIRRTFSNSPMTTTIHMEFINFMLGYYSTWKYLYAEIGGFYGLGVFQWDKSTDCNGIKSTDAVSSSVKRRTAGMYIGAGFIYNISTDYSLKIGIREEHPFVPIAVDKDKLQPDVIECKFGFEYRTSFEF